jgi:beta-lactamase superfamily II metal-dependent hydrolase
MGNMNLEATIVLKVHFLNVGKGNCTIIESPTNRLSMIDIDNSKIDDEERKLADPVEFFVKKFKDAWLFRFILTHPDCDHLSGLNELASKVQIGNFWDTNHNKTINDDSWENSPYDKRDWDCYLKFRNSEENPKCLQLYRNATSECCWVEDGIAILSPTEELVKKSNDAPDDDEQKYHHLSYVLMLDYKGTRFLFGGDASLDAWDDILKAYGSKGLKANVFLAPHHGSKNNTHEGAFKAIAPDYVVVSVAEGIEYDYDFYSKLGSMVLSTKNYGNITFAVKDDGTIEGIYVERNAPK